MLNKVLYSANGTLSDVTAQLSNYYSGTKSFTFNATQDYLYLGSKFPFTRKYFKATAYNSTAATVTVEYWDGAAWRSAAEVIDETGLAGTPLANDGYLTFVPNKLYEWGPYDTVDSSGNAAITGLGSVTIYDLYWIRIRYGAAVAATLAWVGDLFCTDNDVYGEHPELNRTPVKSAFAAGKTDWEEQRMVATELACADLKRLQITPSPGKLLSVDQLRRACVAKTAQVIFTVLQGQQEAAKTAAAEYARRMDPRAFDIDVNDTGQDERTERQASVTRLSR